MSKHLRPGRTLPDFELPDENGDLHRLSDLQGDNCLVLMLGRGEHCPRERQHQREMLRFHEWSSVAFTQLVTVLPNDLHDVYKLKISTGASWTFLADAELELQSALEQWRAIVDGTPRIARERFDWESREFAPAVTAVERPGTPLAGRAR